MPIMDYVLRGVDRSFTVKLVHALRAAEEAGITSAFRDDRRLPWRLWPQCSFDLVEFDKRPLTT